jgi:tetratricopeptide (TPR) repeat protein
VPRFQTFYRIGDNFYCEPCSWKEERSAAERNEKLVKVSVVDGSVCYRCKARSQDAGATDFIIFKGAPVCPNCQLHIQNWPYPIWLKASMAGLLVLLAIALVHDRQYFRAGRVMYRGELLVEQGQYEKAIPLLTEADEIAPQSDKASLLLEKAALHLGDIPTAQKALQSHGPSYDGTSDEFQEVSALWKRANNGIEKANKAAELLDKPGSAEEAAVLMRQAATEYPEAPQIANALPYFESGAAFERKEYDRYLQLAEAGARLHPQSPRDVADLAGALACKYAVTGEAAFRRQSEDTLERARQLSQGDSETEKAFQEYAVRLKYRMDTREIINKEEYNLRFPNSQVAK